MWLIVISLILLILGIYYVAPFIDNCVKSKLALTNEKDNKIQENWANYRTPYFDFARTGNDPLMFYNKPVYRKPYRWPFTFFKSYPYAHMSYFEFPGGGN